MPRSGAASLGEGPGHDFSTFIGVSYEVRGPGGGGGGENLYSQAEQQVIEGTELVEGPNKRKDRLWVSRRPKIQKDRVRAEGTLERGEREKE